MVETIQILTRVCDEASDRGDRGFSTAHLPLPKSLPPAEAHQVKSELQQLRHKFRNLESARLLLVVPTVASLMAEFPSPLPLLLLPSSLQLHLTPTSPSLPQLLASLLLVPMFTLQAKLLYSRMMDLVRLLPPNLCLSPLIRISQA